VPPPPRTLYDGRSPGPRHRRYDAGWTYRRSRRGSYASNGPVPAGWNSIVGAASGGERGAGPRTGYTRGPAFATSDSGSANLAKFSWNFRASSRARAS
jgi:hypothetical protein